MRRRRSQSPLPPRRDVVPVVTTGLHCGAAKSPCVLRCDGRVVPVVTTGLHCGSARGRSASTISSRVVPVVTTGLHCGPVYPPDANCSRACRPRRHDGAPLRHARGRSAGNGLSGRPRRHDGAPLRPAKRGNNIRVPVESSPSSRRGSIAALSLRCSCGGTPSRPRRHDGAPLRRQ